MALEKRDRNGTRTTADVERRYKLGQIPVIEEDVEDLKGKWVVDSTLSATSTNPVQNKIITNSLNDKVNKVDGKGLSTNDFTNEYKNKIDANSGDSHKHSNKEILDKIVNHLNSVVLFEDEEGVIDDIVLSKKIETTIKFIDIIFSNSSDIYSTLRVYDPIGKIITLTLGSCTSTGYANRTQTYTISETGLTAGARHKFALNSTGVITVTNSASITDTDKLKVHKVIGYEQ